MRNGPDYGNGLMRNGPDYAIDFIRPDFNDPTSFGANFWKAVYNDRPWDRINIDAGGTLAAPGGLRPAFRGGLRLSIRGLDVYYGFGLGSGRGAAITVNYSSAAIDAVTVGFSAKGGNGIYGYSLSASTGSSGSNISGGFGWGIGNGVSGGATHRIRLLGF